MYRPLKPNQRKFLEYLRDNHKSVGCTRLIEIILTENSYDIDDISVVLLWFKKIRDEGYSQNYYGVITKYLKG